jgi:hypothetical protein
LSFFLFSLFTTFYSSCVLLIIVIIHRIIMLSIIRIMLILLTIIVGLHIIGWIQGLTGDERGMSIIVPSIASWFNPASVHEIETRSLPDFFNGRCYRSKGPEMSVFPLCSLLHASLADRQPLWLLMQLCRFPQLHGGCISSQPDRVSHSLSLSPPPRYPFRTRFTHNSL